MTRTSYANRGQQSRAPQVPATEGRNPMSQDLTTGAQMVRELAHDTGRSERQVEMIRDMLAPGLLPEDFQLFMLTAKQMDLDPLRKEIYGIKAGGRLAIIVGIDGFRKRSEEAGTYMPDDQAPHIAYDDDGNIVSAEVRLKKWSPLSRSYHPVVGRAKWSEYQVANSPMWKKMPETMLAKCAEALAHRKGWPSVHAGYYAPEEMDQAQRPQDPINITPEPAPEPRDSFRIAFTAGKPEPVAAGDLRTMVNAWLGTQSDPAAIEDFRKRNLDETKAWALQMGNGEGKALRADMGERVRELREAATLSEVETQLGETIDQLTGEVVG